MNICNNIYTLLFPSWSSWELFSTLSEIPRTYFWRRINIFLFCHSSVLSSYLYSNSNLATITFAQFIDLIQSYLLTKFYLDKFWENRVTSIEWICKIVCIFHKLATVVEGNQKDPFSIATTSRCREGATPFPGLLHFTLDMHLILQGGIKYHF